MSFSLKLVFTGIVILLCATGSMQVIAGYAGDKNWLLLAAEKWLDGGRLYIDIVEVNPPLIIWIYAIPAFAAKHLPLLQDYQLQALFGLMAAGVSIAACDRVLIHHPGFAGDKVKRAKHALLLGCIFIAAVNPAVFFDREHVFELLTLPYLLRCMPSLAPRSLSSRLSFLVGCTAGLGFCIKPHCAVVFICVQLLCWRASRGPSMLWKKETLLIYAVALAYAALIVTCTPEYLTLILPMALETYSAVGNRAGGLLFMVVALVMLGVALADFSWRLTSPFRRDIWYLLGLCGAFFLYGLANNGWGYTYYPLISFCLLVTGWLGMEYRWLKRAAEAEGRPFKSFTFGGRACAISLFCVIGYYAASFLFIVSTSCTQHLKCHRWGRELEETMQGAASFGTISGDFDIWTRLAKATGAQWDTRFNHLWMMPKFFISGEDFRQSHMWILRYVAGALADDMNRKKPVIMFVDNADIFHLTPVHVNLVGYFSAFPDFKEAMNHYRHEGAIHTCSHPETVHCNFEIYRRMP